MKLSPPRFWNAPFPNRTARWLTPLSTVTDHISQRRKNRPALKVAVPVLCCGNISVGGTGKTPLALDLAKRLQERGRNPHFLTRGHGGHLRGFQQVLPEQHTVHDVGDEALLLAAVATTWRGSNRFLTAQEAILHGADCLIMDDGLQNHSLHKDFSFLVVDGSVGLGNGRLLPAGPLRESLERTLDQIHAVAIIGNDKRQTAQIFPPALPVIKARYVPSSSLRNLTNKQIVAFAGIGRPEKFFTMLHEAGLSLSRCLHFPDHYHYTARDLRHLLALTRAPGITLVTTGKDAVRLPADFLKHVHVLESELIWQNPSILEQLLDHFLAHASCS